MAHYAFLCGDGTNTVVEVIVGRDEGDDGIDWEQHYSKIRGLRCLRTSFNTRGGDHLTGGVPFRLNYAGVGYRYVPELDGFVPPCPGDGYTLDPATGQWLPGQ